MIRTGTRQPITKVHGGQGILVACIVSAIALWVSPAVAETTESTERETLGIRYPEGRTISVKFLGTSRLPSSSGEAKVERKKGMTEIEIELDEMKPASLIGGDYNTYVLWVASPEGHVDNTGEFILEGNRSKLNVSTPLEAFGMFVTAEPHFLVATPSRFIVLENTEPTVNDAHVTVSRIPYEGSEGIYDFVNESLEDMQEAKGEIRPQLDAARTAVALAERAGADKFAAEALSRARESLNEAERAANHGVTGKALMPYAHETIRLAVDAQKIAAKRSFESALEAERRANAERIEQLRADAQAAANDAERARVKAEQRDLERSMEIRAREAAEVEAEQARRRAEMAVAEKMEAEKGQLIAEQERIEAEAERLKAEMEAAEARREREQARAELEEALRRVAEVRVAARGLIVEVPDVLFEFDSARLTAEGREKLAKISGVLLVAGEHELSIEGHTDSIGSERYNQELSRRRASSVREYLVSQQIDPAGITTEGFGEDQPIASNDTDEGRQRNRRVEIVIANEEAPARVSESR